MKRINTPTSVNGRFVDGDGRTQKATQFSAEWCNQMQEELCNFLAALGIASPTGLSEREIADAFLSLKSVNYTRSSPGGAVKTTEVGSDGIEIKIEFGSGSQEQSKTTTIDCESVTTETVKAKKIQGTTASGAQDYKLVCTTGLDVGTQDTNAPLHVNGGTTLNGDTAVNGDIIIGSAQTNKSLTVNGTQTVNGAANFNCDVTVGSEGQNGAKSLTHYGPLHQNGAVGINGDIQIGSQNDSHNEKVYGNFEATGLSNFASVEVATRLRVPYMNANASQTSQLPHTDVTTRRGNKVGDMLCVVNRTDESRYVAIYKRTDVAYDAFVRVSLKSGHAVMLICTDVDDTVPAGSSGASSWAAMTDADYDM